MPSKKLFLSSMVFIVLVSLPLIGSVGASSLMWTQTYGSGDHEVAHRVIETSDKGYVLGGYTRDINEGEYDSDFLMVKTDINGNMEWNQTYELMEYDRVGSFIETSDGGFALAGESAKIWLIKTDKNGDIEWKQTYGSANDSGAPYSIVQTPDLGYALAGWIYTISGEGSTDVWLIKTDMYGNLEWNRTYGSAGSDRARSLIITSDGGFALAGIVWSITSSSYDFWLIKTDANGVMMWNQTYDYNNGWWEEATFVVETADGGYVIAGIANFPPPLPVSHFWLIKTDAYGNMEWSKTYAETENKKVNSIVMTSDGGFALAGSTTSLDIENFWLVKTDARGNVEWSQTHGESESDIAHSLVETSDGGYAIAGETYSLGAGESDFWLIKTDEIGNIPEFPSWFILPLFLVSTVVVIFCKKKLAKSS